MFTVAAKCRQAIIRTYWSFFAAVTNKVVFYRRTVSNIQTLTNYYIIKAAIKLKMRFFGHKDAVEQTLLTLLPSKQHCFFCFLIYTSRRHRVTLAIIQRCVFWLPGILIQYSVSLQSCFYFQRLLKEIFVSSAKCFTQLVTNFVWLLFGG